MGFSLRRWIGGGERRSSPVHPRDPVLAAWWGNLTSTAAGVSVTPDNALRCPAVKACVGLLADTVATVPLDLFEGTGADARERAVAHPLHRLLHGAPNAWQTSVEFRQHLMAHLCTHNNAYARIRYRGDGLPESLEPLHPGQVFVFRLDGGGHAYRYTDEAGRVETLADDQVLHLRRRPFSRDGLTGVSTVTEHRETIGLALAAAEYLARFFSNSAMPKKGIKMPTPANDATIKTLRESWERHHQGIDNAHKLAIFYGGMEPVDLGMSNVDGQIVELYRNQVAEVARLWGVPLHMIGETDKATSWGTGIEQQSIGFIVYFMRPWFVTWEQALDRALLTPSMRGRFHFEFNADGLLRGDFKSRMDGYALMIQWGLATPNEIRRLMNLPALPGGDSRLQPLNMAPAEKIMDILLKPSAQAVRVLADLTGQEA